MTRQEAILANGNLRLVKDHSWLNDYGYASRDDGEEFEIVRPQPILTRGSLPSLIIGGGRQPFIIM